MPKNPQDHKSSTFTYELHGNSVTLPSFESVMTFGRARRLRGLPEEEQVFTIMEEVCTPEQLAILDEMTPADTERFFAAWQAGSEASLGE